MEQTHREDYRDFETTVNQNCWDLRTSDLVETVTESRREEHEPVCFLGSVINHYPLVPHRACDAHSRTCCTQILERASSMRCCYRILADVRTAGRRLVWNVKSDPNLQDAIVRPNQILIGQSSAGLTLCTKPAGLRFCLILPNQGLWIGRALPRH